MKSVPSNYALSSWIMWCCFLSTRCVSNKSVWPHQALEDDAFYYVPWYVGQVFYWLDRGGAKMTQLVELHFPVTSLATASLCGQTFWMPWPKKYTVPGIDFLSESLLTASEAARWYLCCFSLLWVDVSCWGLAKIICRSLMVSWFSCCSCCYWSKCLTQMFSSTMLFFHFMPS